MLWWGFQVVYPFGLWSRLSRVVKVLIGYGQYFARRGRVLLTAFAVLLYPAHHAIAPDYTHNSVYFL